MDSHLSETSMYGRGAYDDDPPPRGSPKLYDDLSALNGRITAAARLARPTDGQMDRLRRDIAIYAAIESGMSQRMAAKVFNMSKSGLLHAYRRIERRKSRA
jgi:hypothetical protein